jgi:hypothetical protein
MRLRTTLICISTLLGACASAIQSPTTLQLDPVSRETEVRHARPRLNGEIFDPIESDPALASAFADADRKAERIVKNTKRDSLFVTQFWSEKKRILQADYGVTWRTPAEMNPQIEYANYGQPLLTDTERNVLATLVSGRKLDSERIHGMGREFNGDVWVSTTDQETDTARLYRFTGHDTEWSFLSVGTLEE